MAVPRGAPPPWCTLRPAAPDSRRLTRQGDFRSVAAFGCPYTVHCIGEVWWRWGLRRVAGWAQCLIADSSTTLFAPAAAAHTVPFAPAAHSSRVPPAAASPCEPQDSAVGFLLQLEGGAKVQAHVYLCYADGQPYRTASGCGGSEEEELFGW